MSINGFLNLGVGLSGSVVLPPPSGAGYSPQYVSFDDAPGGVTLNGVSCIFGPVTAPWGTLTSFGVTDSLGNPVFAGTLQFPFTPLIGQLVTVPAGNISLVVGSNFTAGTFSSVAVVPVAQTGPTISGSVTLNSGAYTLVLASGARSALALTNADSANTVRVILGDTQPASGALGYLIVPPFETWPSAGFGDYVPSDGIWAITTALSGQVLNVLTAAFPSIAPPSPPPVPENVTTSGTIALSSSAYLQVLPSTVRKLLSLTNADQQNTVRIILGGLSPPASGALGYSIIPPYETWPPPSFGSYVPSDTVWALGTVNGQVLNYLTG
jgi:hypothetical protein